MATEGNENRYEAGTSTGGKFRKRPFGRTKTTPYDRPPTTLQNPSRNSNGWFSKLVVDPAHRLITHSAHSLFSSLFRKRLTPAPPHSSETEQEVRGNHQEEATFVANNPSGKQQRAVDESDVQINCSDGAGLTELEKILKQKTFTRAEIDQLTALMRSRTVDAPVSEEERKSVMVPSEPFFPFREKEDYPKTPVLENGIENHLVKTPDIFTSSVPTEDVASPAALAKSYMGSRHSNVSSSMLGMQNPALREDSTLLKSENCPLKSPSMSIVPRATRHAAVHENGYVTSRPHGRSAIYSMARTPYSRIGPTSTLKGGRLAIEGGPSSSTQPALDHGLLSVSKQTAVKRRSFALDNDIGSGGPIRRVRQKSNLLSPLSGSLSFTRTGLGIDAAQQHSSSMQKPKLLDEVKHNHLKLSEQNGYDTIPSTSFTPLRSNSSKAASKILQQLDKMVSPKKKSSELRLPSPNNNPPMKLSPSMLHGQALRSMEMVDSSKLLDNLQSNKSDGTLETSSATAQKQMFTSQGDKVENSPLKPSNELVPVAKPVDSFMINSVPYPPQKKRAFRLSAHEDSLDLDGIGDAYTNGAVYSFSPLVKETTSSTVTAEKISSGTGAIAQENPSTVSVVMPSQSFTTVDEAHGPRFGEKVNVSTSITPSISEPTYTSGAAATRTKFGFAKPDSVNGSIANPPQFNFGNKAILSTGLMSTSAQSNEITKSGSIFGLQKVISSKEPGADGSPVNIGTSKNNDEVPPMTFTASTPVGNEPTFMTSGASDSKPGSSFSPTTVAGGNDSMLKARGSDDGDAKTNIDTGSSVRASELAVSSSASTSLLTSPASIFTGGHNSNQNNGSLASSPSFPASSPSPSLISNNFTSQDKFSSSSLAASFGSSATAASTGTSMTTITSAMIASSNNSFSIPAVATSSSTTSLFKFGSSPTPSTGLPLSSSGSEPLETKSKQDAGSGSFSSTVFGSSSAAVGSSGIGIFGFSSPPMTTVTSQPQCSVVGASSGCVNGTQASTGTSGFATSTQTQSVPFGSSASSPSFGLTGNPAFSSGTFFPSSSSAANTSVSSGSSLFSSSSSTSNFNSATTFGLSTSASSAAANSVNSNSGTSATLFGSSWPASNSPFGSSFSTSSSSGFSFGATTASAASTISPTTTSSAPQFSFSSAAATTSTQPAFGSSNPVFSFGSAPAPVNNSQVSMEDSMTEDTFQPAPPAATPIFGQQPPVPVQSNFVFGGSTPSGGSPFQFGGQKSIAPQNPPSGANPFQFGGQQSIAPQNPPSGAHPFQFGGQQSIAPQNPSPFQASGSLEFPGGGGSFSLGTGGADKSGRKILRVKHKQRKK